MKICQGWTALLFGLTLLTRISADEYDGGYGDVDFFNTEHDFDQNQRSQSISFKSDDDDEEDEGSYEPYKKQQANLNHPKLQKIRSIQSDPDITRSYLYVSPEEVDNSAPRHTRNAKRATKQDDKFDYDRVYQQFLSENFSPDAKPDKSAAYIAEASQKNDDAEEISKSDYEFSRPNEDYERIKYLSSEQAKEIKKSKGACKTVIKGEMRCEICEDPKSGANSQSCSYSSAPDPKKYAYTREKKYNSKDQEKEDDDDDEEGGDDNGHGGVSDIEHVEHRKPSHNRSTKTPTTSKKSRKPKSYKRKPKKHFENYKVAETRPQRDVVGLDPYLYGSSEEYKADETEESPKTFESYFSHVFPEPEKKSSYKQKTGGKSARIQLNPNGETEYETLPGYNPKKKVDSVLAEFKTKDWSKCDKVIKGGTTCYNCKDKDGVKYEECMFVSDSKPKKSRILYEENKRYYEDDEANRRAPKKKSKSKKHRQQQRHDDDDVEYADSQDEGSQQKDIISEQQHQNAQILQATTTEHPNNNNNKKSKKIIIKKRKNYKKSENLELNPETNSELNSQPESEKRTFKRTVSYKIEGDSHAPKSMKSIKFIQRISHSS